MPRCTPGQRTWQRSHHPHLPGIAIGLIRSIGHRARHAEDAPTFHKILSLCMEQGGIDTKALLGHMTDAMADLYANSRGLEPIKVRINAA
ncbi:hypothetical protein [Cupriavidus necator]